MREILYQQPIRLLRNVTFFVVSATVPAMAADIDGFTEPYREIDVAAAETGIIASIDVKEGDRVQEGQILSKLDQDVLRMTLEIGRKRKEARGQLNSSKAEVSLKEDRLIKLRELRRSDHANQEEVDRAITERDIAEARLLTAHEDIEVKQLEFERTKLQLERRNILSPIDGVIIRIFKDVGEFVAPTDPVVLRIVQLNPLLATFSVPSDLADNLVSGQTVHVKVHSEKTSTEGTIEYVSPVTDAESGTVRIKVRLPNNDERFRSGEKCSLILPRNRRK